MSAPEDAIATVRPVVVVVTRDLALADELQVLLRARGYDVRLAHTPTLDTDLPIRRVVLDARDLTAPADATATIRSALAPDGDLALLVLIADETDAEAILAAGATDFLVLPCARVQLRARLTAAFTPRSLDPNPASVALVDSHRALQTLLAHLPGVVYRCANDRDWTMEFISECCVELTGYSPADFTSGRVSFGGLIHHEDRDRVWEHVQESLAERRPFRITYRLHTATGACKWLWEQGQGVFDPTGRLIALEGFISDLSELRQTKIELEEREVLLETLLAVTETAYILCDHEGNVAYANLAAQTWLGLPDSRLVGARFSDLLTGLPGELRDAVDRGRDSIFTVDHQGG
ncbi:MAG TPA: PAS domain-containing protein, partial [Nannocystis sp.]